MEQMARDGRSTRKYFDEPTMKKPRDSLKTKVSISISEEKLEFIVEKFFNT